MDDGNFQLAKNYALRLLSIRPRSEKELRDKLSNYIQKKHYEVSLIENILDNLKELNFINDLEFAKWWVDQRKRGSVRGITFVRFELFQKGIARNIVNTVIKSQDSNQESEKARALLSKYLRAKSQVKLSPVMKQKLKAYLYRRGFSPEIINQSIDEYIKKS